MPEIAINSKRPRRKFRKLFPLWNICEYALLRLTTTLINSFPITVSTWIARRIGEAMFLLMPARRNIALANLDIAFGDSKSITEKRSLAVQSFRHFITALMEFTRLPKFVKKSARHVQFEGCAHLQRAFARGKGLILVMSHLGPWEYLALLAYLKRIPSTILGKSIRNPYIFKWVKSLRNTANLKHSDKAMGAKGVFRELRQNHLVALAIDQWAGSEGLWVDFFGRPTSTTSLPVRLAQRTGCALIPAYCIRTGCGEYKILIKSEVPLGQDRDDWEENTTARLNNLLEQQIRAHPAQWMWTHRRWKTLR